MENFDEFSSIEQAAMEQSPASETDVRHNFMEASNVLDDVVHDVGHAAKEVGQVTAGAAKAVTPETPEVAEATLEAAAGGVVIDGVFSKQQVELLKSVNHECSIDELIDLRSSLINANRMLK